MKHKRVNIRLLEVFVSVVRHQGYSGAQQDLNLTTSAISNYMSELEEHVGFILCRRGRSGFMLTEKGQKYLQYVETFLEEYDQLEKASLALDGNEVGAFNLAILDATVMDKTLNLPEILRAFHDEFPGTQLNLLTRGPHELVQGVLDERFDAAIGTFPSKVSNLIDIPLYKEQHWLYCSHQHPLFNEHLPSIEEVKKFGVVSRSYWKSADLRKRGFGYSTATVDTMEAQLALILSGRYVGYLPENYAELYMQKNLLKPITPSEFGFQAPFSLVFKRGRARELPIKKLRELAKEHAQKSYRNA
ncbi:LysR family transcriptional regulator [Marinomonas communis]|uniref:LysR family transcriptional regulator n=1 Tax=Marinomonas communis TaxID=28254 RepID=A0A4R6X4U4_9GAMM|nr:LysR family transcriptional regulator [Marinomonas communis]TDR13992.1 LysR family transcriptional regulator [Marinomonas communis]